MSSIARRVAIMQWSPRRLGSGLYAAWDPEEPASLDLSGGAVSTWRDFVNGSAPTQALGSLRPAYGVSPFNGRPIITPDGVDDQLTLVPIPPVISSAPAFEIWCIWNQTSLVADTTTRSAISWGFNTGAAGLQRAVVGGVNRAQLAVGNGTSTVVAPNTNVDFSGRHVVRGVFDGATARVDVDGIAGTPVAATLVLGGTRLRLFANPNNTAGGFAAGDFSGTFITRLLLADEATRMNAFCNKRIV